jgi:Ca-activated chloride channel family protein
MRLRRIGRRIAPVIVLGHGLLLWHGYQSYRAARWQPARGNVTGGELRILGADHKPLGTCPLANTDVVADVAGYVGRVRVRQTFHNPLDRPIEAVYLFPLPHGAAVDDMAMTIGTRRIVGRIQPRAQARRTYERAKAAGKVAGLLDQERPNIFTQAVANIEPGAEVEIEIRYVETLAYRDSVVTWVFPTVVGPRYVPGAATGKEDTRAATTRVPDAAKISPPVLPRTRPGHDLHLTVNIDAGMELRDLRSDLHAVAIRRSGTGRAVVTLLEKDAIPNRDFILHYRTATDRIEDALLVHEDHRGAYFTLILQPPRRVAPAAARPKEMIFVIDRSGSMEGFPLAKARSTMQRCIERMNPRDTFNLISFSENLERLFPEPRLNTPANRGQALLYLARLQAGGGTEMLPAIHAALERPADPDRLRIVCFMSDGFVGNDFEILDAVRKNAAHARLFAFGIGDSVNRFLLDGMASAGRGEVEYVTQAGQGDAAAVRFQERIQSPVLTDIHIDWGGLPVTDVYPRQLPDLYDRKPIMIHFRASQAASAGAIVLRGNGARGTFERVIHLQPSGDTQGREALASLWARAKVQDLMTQDMAGLQSGSIRPDLKAQITALGVEYRLMTQFTSFVAVDETVVTAGGSPMTIPVAAAMPRGMSARGMFGTAGGPIVQARAGDPLIHVEAPADARQVIALLPDGVIKQLTFHAESHRWEARFDIPTYAAEGDYAVTVIVLLRDGTRQVLSLHYRVDMSAPTGKGRAQVGPAGAPVLRLEVTASPDTARVAALLPWGARVELAPSPTGGFEARVPVPMDWDIRAGAVKLLLTDRAHNRMTLVIDLRNSGAARVSRGDAPPRLAVVPSTDAAFTSTRQITGIAVVPVRGTGVREVWVAARGGVLQRRQDGTWRKYTRLDGLPEHEVCAITATAESVTAVFPRATAEWRHGRWHVRAMRRAALPTTAALPQTCAIVWRGTPWRATAAGLYAREGRSWRRIALPASAGTHVSALLPRGGSLWAALYGDGLWALLPALPRALSQPRLHSPVPSLRWQRLALGLPTAAREITALAGDGDTVWLGTQHEGLWEYDGRKWTQHLSPDEPYDHNCQTLTRYRGDLYASTLDSGLVIRTAAGWEHAAAPTISSDAPRQMVVFQDALYLRHGSGKIDRCDGRRWQRDVGHDLPRRQATALAADRERLYVAQWGGWSEFDGQTWQHHLRCPELQGLPITALLPDGGTLWLGTQNRGIAEVDRVSDTVHWHDERHGLPDDWVTVLAHVQPGAGEGGSDGGREGVTGGKGRTAFPDPVPPSLTPSLYAGTFIGGLARREGARWSAIRGPAVPGTSATTAAAVYTASSGSECVTALETDDAGGLFVGTRGGVWYQAPDGLIRKIAASAAFLDAEVQCLCAVADGLWAGTRTGLYFVAAPASARNHTSIEVSRKRQVKRRPGRLASSSIIGGQSAAIFSRRPASVPPER